MNNAEYHAHPALSKSGLDQINRSPAHYQAWLTDPRIETPAMKIGTAAHCAILEPDRFQTDYIAAPEGIDRRTKAGKEQWADMESSGKIILPADDYAALLAMRESVMSHPSARELLSEGVAEQSYFGQLWGVDVKCRPDWLISGIVVDLKTTQDASLSGFSKSIANYRYAVQHAFYSDVLAACGIDVSAFIFVAVEKVAPYAIGVYELDAASVEVGREAYQRNLDTYKRCLDTGEWPAYSNAIESISLPKWAIAA
mgnify:CR=1 FL=1